MQTENSNNVEGIQPPAKDWLANGVMQSVKSDADMDCASWIEEPVVVVSRVEYANFYHTMTDFVGAWCAMARSEDDAYASIYKQSMHAGI